MKIAVDVDGTICTWHPLRYHEAEPLPERIERVQELAELGHEIWIYTARGSSLGDADNAEARWGGLTRAQLAEWGVPYRKLMFGKPAFDLLIDDRVIPADDDWLTRVQEMACSR